MSKRTDDTPSMAERFGLLLLDSTSFGYAELERYRRGEPGRLVLDGSLRLDADMADFIADRWGIAERPAEPS